MPPSRWRLVGSRGRVVGIDIDATKIELARGEAAAAKLSNVEFRVAEAGQGGAAAEFDLVYARFVLTHLRDPAGILAEMRGRLRPGGMVVLEDIDFRGHFCHPENLAFWRYVELYSQMVRARGADPDIGPRLPALLLDAGYENVQLQVVQPAGMEGEVKLIAAITMENIADSVLAEGLASRRELDGLVRDLYAFAANPRSVMSIPRVVQAWGERGPSAPT